MGEGNGLKKLAVLGTLLVDIEETSLDTMWKMGFEDGKGDEIDVENFGIKRNVENEKKEGKKMEESLKKGKEKMVEIEKKMSVVKVFDLN